MDVRTRPARRPRRPPQPRPRPRADGARRPRRRLGRLGGPALVVLLVAGVAVAVLWFLGDPGTGVLRGLRVGAAAAADDEGALRAQLTALTEERAAVEVVATRDARRLRRTAADVGWELDVDATVAAAVHRGRQGNPVTAFLDRARSLLGGADVRLVQRVDPERLEDWVAEVGDRLTTRPEPGGFTYADGEVGRVEPASGELIDGPALAARARRAVLRGQAVTIPVEVTVGVPGTDSADVDGVVAAAERAVSGPMTLYRGPATLTFTPAEVAAMLRAEVVAAPDGPGLELVVDPEALTAHLTPEEFTALDVPPVDAGFDTSGERVEIVPGVAGFAFDAEVAAAQMLALAVSEGPHVAELEGRAIPPERDAEEAAALGITGELGSFTTSHACCEGRVVNIHRIADLVDGTIIPLGETFSLNGHVGERTRERGFVDGGAIENGEFVDTVGGGVSQFATTLFNAAFFGGLELVEHQAHSYYLDRYPVGREATLNFDPPVDLKLANTSPAALLIEATYSDTAVTVTLWGTPFVEVQAETSERYGFREPEEETRVNPERPPGSSRLLQGGAQGFTVEVTRILTWADGREERELYATTYAAAPRIVELGPPAPPAATAAPQEPLPQEPETEPAAPAPQPPPAAEEPAPPPAEEPAPTAAPTAAPGTRRGPRPGEAGALW